MPESTRRTRSLARLESALSLVPETRGLRIRPRPRVKASWVARSLENAARAGFNTIVMDAFYGGLTSYPSQLAVQAGLPSRFPAMGVDFLAEASEHADRLGLMLYAGIDVALLGRNSMGAASLVHRKHPGWLAQTRNGSYVLSGGPEPGSEFLCPANPRVRRYVAGLAREMSEAYRIDGLFLDYLRFPLRAAFPETAFCFCESCCQGVARDLGFDLEKMPMSVDDPDYLRWTNWRSEQLTRLLYAIRARAQKGRSSLRMIVNTPGGYSPDILQRDVMHDWVGWVRDELVSLVSLRYSSTARVKPEVALPADLAQAPPQALLFLAVSSRDFEQDFAQLRAAREAGLAGFFYLVKPGLSREQARAISDYLRPQAVPVERDVVQSAIYYLDRAAEDAVDAPAMVSFVREMRQELLALAQFEPAKVASLAARVEQKRAEVQASSTLVSGSSLDGYLAVVARLLRVYDNL